MAQRSVRDRDAHIMTYPIHHYERRGAKPWNRKGILMNTIRGVEQAPAFSQGDGHVR
jgi:hypothetical protein